MSTASGAVPGQRRADGLHDPAPVRVAAVQRGLHERRVGDRARGASTPSACPPRTTTRAIRRGALAVGDHHDRELAQQRVERLAEAQLVLALGRDLDAAGAGAHQDRGVVGRQLPVDRGAVEGALDAHAQQQLGASRRAALGVGLDEAQHRGEARRDHPRALALGAEPDGARRQLDLEAGALLERVGGLDRLLEVGVAVAAQLRARPAGCP